MSDSNFKPVKPCIKCGGIERYAYGACKSCKKASSASWYAANPERAKLTNAAWYQANSEEKDRKVNAYRAANTEKRRIITLAWRSNNRELDRAAARNWAKNNKAAKASHEYKRRALQKSLGGRLSPGLVVRLTEQQKGLCACCRILLNGVYHLDHIIPVALNGTNTDDNIQLLCPPCNCSKGKKHPIEFMQTRGFLL